MWKAAKEASLCVCVRWSGGLFLVPHSPGTPSSSAPRMVNAGCYGCRKGRVGGGDTVKVLVSLCQPESLLNKDSIPAVR